MRFSGVVAMAMALVPVVAMAQATDQFDLNCRGILHPRPGDPEIKMERRYHIDLKANRWCFDGCVTPKAITGVTPDMITLEKLAARDNYLHTEVNRFVNRQNGAVFDSDGDGHYYTGQCEKADFTPLPQPKF